VLIVEGPDGSGKSSLIKAIQKAYDIEVAPRVVSKDAEATVDLQDWVDDNLMHGFQRQIFDRHRLISETIYGPALRNEASPGFSDPRWLMMRMTRFYGIKPIIIYCLPPIAAVKLNVSDDPDNVVVRDRIEAIYSAYASRFALEVAHEQPNIWVWDYVNDRQKKGLPLWMPEVMNKMNRRIH